MTYFIIQCYAKVPTLSNPLRDIVPAYAAYLGPLGTFSPRHSYFSEQLSRALKFFDEASASRYMDRLNYHFSDKYDFEIVELDRRLLGRADVEFVVEHF